MVFRYGQMQPTSWDDALDLVARVTVAMLKEPGGEDNLFVSAFDHGGAGGGYENTWGTGKLYFEAMKVKNIRIHNRPGLQFRGACHARHGRRRAQQLLRGRRARRYHLRVGTNAYETQTNYFLNHWIPNLRGHQRWTRRKQQTARAKPIPRPASSSSIRGAPSTVSICEAEAGKDRVLHLAIEPGTDMVLFNALS